MGNRLIRANGFGHRISKSMIGTRHCIYIGMTVGILLTVEFRSIDSGVYTTLVINTKRLLVKLLFLLSNRHTCKFCFDFLMFDEIYFIGS